MDKEILKEKLKASSITIGKYIPSNEVKSMTNTIITLNGEPLLGLGSSEDLTTQEEAAKLIKSNTLLSIAEKFASKTETTPILTIEHINGKDIKWKESETCIAESEVGLTEEGNEDGNMIWIVFGKDALGIATLMCITKEIEDIVTSSLSNLNKNN